MDRKIVTNLLNNLLSEALKLAKKDNNRWIIVSDLDDPKKAKSETFKNKEEIKRHGGKWDGKSKEWYFDAKEVQTIEKLKDIYGVAENIIDAIKKDNKSEPSAKELLQKKVESYVKELGEMTQEALKKEVEQYLEFVAKFNSKFHNYSMANMMLIMLQKPTAKRVASFQKWKKMGRGCKKGTGIKVWVPIFTPKGDKKDKEEENPTEINEREVVGFKVGNVFDISDTYKLSDDAEDMPEPPQWWSDDEPSEVAEKLFEHMKTIAKEDNIDVIQDLDRGEARGASYGGKIRLKQGTSGVGRLKTMVHEYAHELLHHTTSKFKTNEDETKVIEWQAETVAYAVCRHYDLKPSGSANYLALWRANREDIMKQGKKINNIITYIIDRIDELETVEINNDES